MPTIDEFDIPAALLTELLGVVDQAKAGSLLSLAKIVPSLGRGLRPTLNNAKFIRQRLAAKVSASTKLGEEIRDFLAHEGLNSQLILVLSETVLAAALTELLAIYGKESLLAAILVDARSGVRQLAVEYCQQVDWPWRVLPDRQLAIASLSETIQPFLTAIDPIIAKGSSTDNRVVGGDESLNAEMQGYRLKIIDLEERLQKARQDKKSDKKIESKVEVLQQRITELEGKLARERQIRLTAESERIDAEASAQSLREAYAGEVQAGIQMEMQGVIRTWLAEPLRIAEAVDELIPKSGEDILEQVKAILVSQEERDRHFGNRHRLRGRLEELRQANIALLQAASEAINPLPELANLICEVQKEVDRLESLLGEKIPVNPVMHRLISSIKQAKSHDDLDRSRRLLHELDAFGCLNQNDIRLLYREYHARLGRIFERFSYQPSVEAKANDPALIINRGFGQGEKFLWLLDGYNILFCLDDIFTASYEDGYPAAQSRKLLLEMVQNLLTGTNGLADVFFDGEVYDQENFSPQVKVIWSGGGNNKVRNRADQAIIDCLERQSAGDKILAVVVTDDRELGGRCQVLGAKVMPLQEFAAYLQR